jgi:hypothetical protein
VAVIEVEVGINVHVHVQGKRMTHVAAITPRLVIRIITGDDVRVFSVVATTRVVVFTRDPNKTAETGWDYGGVRRDGEKGVLLLIVAFETVEEGEKDVVGRMGSGGGVMNGRKLRGSEGADGRMRGGTREEDRERGEKIGRIIEAVYDIVVCGGDGWRAHVWRVAMKLWERMKSVGGYVV